VSTTPKPSVTGKKKKKKRVTLHPQNKTAIQYNKSTLRNIKSMPKCGKFGAASTAGWGAGAAIFSQVPERD
jgi:hypothetical protein